MLGRVNLFVAFVRQQAHTHVFFKMNLGLGNLQSASLDCLKPVSAASTRGKKTKTEHFVPGTLKLLPENDQGVRRPCKLFFLMENV